MNVSVIEVFSLKNDCSNGWVTRYHCSECSSSYRFPAYCKKRTCPDCAPRLADSMIVKYEKIDRYFFKCFFVTLTLKNVKYDCLREGLQKQKDCFKKLCRRSPYNRWFAGGIYGIEVTLSKNHTWNVHMHIAIDSVINLIQAPWIYNRYNTKNTKFSRDWHNITGDSFIVDWQVARHKHKAVEYVLKYLTDTSKVESIRGHSDVIERAFYRFRLLSTFGHIYGGIVEFRPKTPFKCRFCDSVGSLVCDGLEFDYSYDFGLGYKQELLDVGCGFT